MDQTQLFLDVFGEFLKELELKVKYGQKEFEDNCKEISQLIVLFGESADTLPKDFFAMFYTFGKEVSDTYKKLEQKR